MVLLEFSITPLGKGESVSPWVARCVQIVQSSGLDYRLHAMGTIVEGELDQVLDLFRRCVEAVAQDCNRISCTLKLDYRKGYQGRLESKVRSVQEKLAQELKTV